MEVILLQRVDKLGQMGDVVNVKNGFARNYLLPQKKALRATKQNIESFETRRVQLETDNLERRKDAEALVKRVDGLSVVVLRQAAENAQLYGSVNARDIAAAVTEAGVTVDRYQISLSSVIKSLGVHEARIVLHPEVSAAVRVNVARSVEEAQIQEAGLSLQAQQEAADLVAQVEEFFEEPAREEVVEVLNDETAAATEPETPEESAKDEN